MFMKALAKSTMHADVTHNAAFETLLRIGFEWRTELVDQHGRPFNKQAKKNLYPTEGLNAALNILLGSTAKIPNFYFGLFEGNYNPTIADVAATVSAASTETAAFTSPTVRPVWTASAPASGGSIDNYANKAVFTFTATKLIYGGFLIASSAVNSTGGPLLSIVRFDSPYQVYANSILNVGAGCALATA